MKDAWINALEMKGLKSSYKWEVFTTKRIFQSFSGYNQKWFLKQVKLNAVIWLSSSNEIIEFSNSSIL